MQIRQLMTDARSYLGQTRPMSLLGGHPQAAFVVSVNLDEDSLRMAWRPLRVLFKQVIKGTHKKQRERTHISGLHSILAPSRLLHRNCNSNASSLRHPYSYEHLLF